MFIPDPDPDFLSIPDPGVNKVLGYATLGKLTDEASPELGLHKYLVSGNAAVLYGEAHLLLVVVDRGRVNAAVSNSRYQKKTKNFRFVKHGTVPTVSGKLINSSFKTRKQASR